MFFSKNKKIKKEEKVNENNLSDQIERELIVHNMPNQERILGSVSNPLAAGKVSLQEHLPEKKKFKVVGVLIMFFGLVVIAAIVYFAYTYTIAPAANKNIIKEESKQEESKVKELEVEKETPPVVDLNPEESVVEIEPLNQEPDEVEILPLLDDDGDGLSNEEEDIFGTLRYNQDSDGDGYGDLQEILNLYNPAGPGKIEDNENFTFYKNSTYSFEFLYPAKWSANQLNDNTFVLEVDDNSYFQISVMKNEYGAGIVSWYENMFSDENLNLDRLIVKNDFEAIKSVDDLNIYLTDKGRQNIFVLSYMPVVPERLVYKNIFNLMLNSFTFKE